MGTYLVAGSRLPSAMPKRSGLSWRVILVVLAALVPLGDTTMICPELFTEHSETFRNADDDSVFRNDDEAVWIQVLITAEELRAVGIQPGSTLLSVQHLLADDDDETIRNMRVTLFDVGSWDTIPFLQAHTDTPCRFGSLSDRDMREGWMNLPCNTATDVKIPIGNVVYDYSISSEEGGKHRAQYRRLSPPTNGKSRSWSKHNWSCGYPFQDCGYLVAERPVTSVPMTRLCVDISCPGTCLNGGVREVDNTCTCAYGFVGVCCSFSAFGPTVSEVTIGDLTETFTLALITWTAEANAAVFNIYLDDGGGSGLVLVGTASGSARQYTLLDLLSSTSYTVRVAGESTFGFEGISDDANFTSIEGGKPDPPLLWVTAASSVSITVKLAPSSTNGNGVISAFDVYYRPFPSGGWVGPARVGFTVTTNALSPNTAYEFKALAFNGGFLSEESAPVVGYTSGGEVSQSPPIITIEKISGSAVQLTWRQPLKLDLPLSFYRVAYFSTVLGESSRVVAGETQETSFLFTDVPPAVTLEVVAVNVYGDSDPSRAVVTLFACPGDCNGVGSCNLNTGKCTCPKYWLGDGCESPQHCGVTNYGAPLVRPGSFAGGILSSADHTYKVQALYLEADMRTGLDSDDCATTIGFKMGYSFYHSFEELRIESQTAYGVLAMSGWRASSISPHLYISLLNPTPNIIAGEDYYFPLSTCFPAGGSSGRVLDFSEYGSTVSSGGGVYYASASNNRQASWGVANAEVHAYPSKGVAVLSTAIPQLILCTASDTCITCNGGVFVPGTSVCTCPFDDSRACCTQITTVVSVPHAPRFLAGAQAGDKTSVSFVPHFDGNTPITSFVVFVYTDAGKYVTYGVGASSPILVDTSYGQSYIFGITALNDVGSSPKFMSDVYRTAGCAPRSTAWTIMVDCPASGVPEGGTCNETCAPGLASSTVEVTCTGGSWGSGPLCAGCQLTLSAETSSTCEALVSEGTDCLVTCAAGYTGGSTVMSCIGGSFAQSLPVCTLIPGCPALLDGTLAGIVSSNCTAAVATGTLCSLECGLSTGHLVCAGHGVWSGPGVQCTEPLPDCPLSLGAFLSSDCSVEDVHYVGTHCEKTCPEEFGIPPVVAECLAEGFWSDPDPVCTVAGSILFVSEDSYFVGDSNIVTVQASPPLSSLPGVVADAIEISFSSAAAALAPVALSSASPDAPLALALSCAEGAHNFTLSLAQSPRLLYTAAPLRVLCLTRVSVLSWTPTGSSVDPNTEIVLTFTKAVDTASIEATFSLTGSSDGTVYLVGSATWSKNATQATFHPTTQTPNEEYLVNVSGGVAQDGTPLVPFSVTYRTVAFIYFVLPLANAIDVDTAQYVTVAFRERMNESVTEEHFSLMESATGEEVVGTFSWTRGTIFLFTPNMKLQDSTEYEVSLNVGTQSELGETMKYPYLWRFTTRRVAPKIVSVDPLEGALGVGVMATINVEFDKAIDLASFDAAITVISSSGTAINGTTSLVSEKIARFTPSNHLLDSALLEVSLTTALTDVHGNALTQPYDWAFTTVDQTPPTVVRSDPVASAQMVPLDASLSIEFSETMQIATADITLLLRPEVIPTSIGWSADSKTITLYPERALEDSVLYEVMINTAEDLSGLSFTGPTVIAFTTAPKCNPECENGVCMLRNMCACNEGYAPPGLPLEAGETACKTPARLTSVSPAVLPPSGGALRVIATIFTDLEHYVCTFEVGTETFSTNATLLPTTSPAISCPAPTVASLPTLMFLMVSSLEGTVYDNSLSVTISQCEEGLVVRDGECEECPGNLVSSFELSADQSECIPCNLGQMKVGRKCGPSTEGLVLAADEGDTSGGGVSTVALVLVILLLLLLGGAIVGGVWMHMKRKNNMRFYIDEDATVRADAGQNGKSESLVKKMLAKASTNRIGGGEYADIFAAKMDSKVWVALKVLNNGTQVARDEFHREAMALSKIQQSTHPAVVQLVFYMALNPTCIAMELCEGGSIKDALKKGKMPIPKKVRIATEVAAGMLYIHSLDIAHLDLKTDNIMLMEDGTSRIIDFGICKTFDGETMEGSVAKMGGSQSAGSQGLSATPLMDPCGSAGGAVESVPPPPPVEMESVPDSIASTVDEEAYMQRMSSAFAGSEMPHDVAVQAFSPRYCDPNRLCEEYTSRAGFFAADVFSFAMVMWAMYAQAEPYTGVSVKELTVRLRDRPAMRPIVPPGWHTCYGELLKRCWAKTAEARPAFMEIARVLDDCARSDFDVFLDNAYFPTGMERGTGTADEAEFQTLPEMESAEIQSVE